MATAKPEPTAATVNAASTKPDAEVDASRAAAKPSLAIVASVAGATVVTVVWWRRRSRRRRRS